MEHFLVTALALGFALTGGYIILEKFYPKDIEALEDAAKALHTQAVAALDAQQEHTEFLRREGVRLLQSAEALEAGVLARAHTLVTKLEQLL